MALPDILKGISERLESSANVSTVYGEPIVVEGKTVIPVAKVRYGFGGGFGEGKSPSQDDPETNDAEGSGGGGGGGVEVTPIGIIEITSEEMRYISFEDSGRLIKAGFTLALIALFFFVRRLRRRDPK